MSISTGEPLTAGTRTPLSRRLVPRVTARSTVMVTPRRPLRTPATIRPVLGSAPRRYQPPAPAMTAPSSAATATICTIRRARDFMDSQYQTVPRNQDSRSGWAPRIAFMGPDRDHIYGQPRQRPPLWATGTTPGRTPNNSWAGRARAQREIGRAHV